MGWPKKKKNPASKAKRHGGQRCAIIVALNERREMSERQYLKNNSWESYWNVEKDQI